MEDVWEPILLDLSLFDYVVAAQTCRLFNTICEKPSSWNLLLLRDFPGKHFALGTGNDYKEAYRKGKIHFTLQPVGSSGSFECWCIS